MKWIIRTFGKKVEDKHYIGHGDFVSKRLYRLKILKWVFEVDYDTDYA